LEKWPNFFIVGVPKGGTTSLHEYLNRVPGIFMSKIKEPNYFSPTLMPDKLPYKPIRDTKKYLDLFNKSINEKIIGESSTFYLYDPDAPKLIHEKIPNARILISLRDPVNRLYSHYQLIRKNRFTDNSFHDQVLHEMHDEIDPGEPHMRLQDGKHSICVKRYLDIFGPNQVKIIIFEEWIKNPKKTLQEILEFLEINQRLENFQADVYNPYTINRWKNLPIFLRNDFVMRVTKYIPEPIKLSIKKLFMKKEINPKIEEIDRDLLIKFYQDDVEKLKKILARDLPWTNFQN